MREQRGQSSVLLVGVIVCMTTCGVCGVVGVVVQVFARDVAQVVRVIVPVIVRVVVRGVVRMADRLGALPTGQGQQPVRQGLALRLPTGDDHDRVVAGDGAQNVRLV